MTVVSAFVEYPTPLAGGRAFQAHRVSASFEEPRLPIDIDCAASPIAYLRCWPPKRTNLLKELESGVVSPENTNFTLVVSERIVPGDQIGEEHLLRIHTKMLAGPPIQ